MKKIQTDVDCIIKAFDNLHILYYITPTQKGSRNIDGNYAMLNFLRYLSCSRPFNSMDVSNLLMQFKLYNSFESFILYFFVL